MEAGRGGTSPVRGRDQIPVINGRCCIQVQLREFLCLELVLRSFRKDIGVPRGFLDPCPRPGGALGCLRGGCNDPEFGQLPKLLLPEGAPDFIVQAQEEGGRVRHGDLETSEAGDGFLAGRVD